MSPGYVFLPDEEPPPVPAAAIPANAGYRFIGDEPPKLGLPPASAADRLQAAETGPLKAAAGILGSVPDVIPNLYGLGTSAYDAYQHYVGGKDWADLPRPTEPNPVTHAITNEMDKSPVTSTQLNRPDDTASRYLSTAAEAATGGVKAVLPAVAGEAAYESKPFEGDWANQLLATGVQAATGHAQPGGAKVNRPGYEVSNENVRKGQELGFKYPPATTNPTGGNKTLESTAGKTSVQQHAAIHNQPVADNVARQGLDLPGDGPISKEDFATIRREENARYNAVRQAGAIQLDTPEFRTAAGAATQQFNGTAAVSPTLGGRNDVQAITQEILRQPVHDSGNLLDTIKSLRNEATKAYRAGDHSTGAAYSSLGGAIEDQMERSLAAPGSTTPPSVVQGFAQARQRLARAHTIEDHWDSTTGHVDAASLHLAKENGEYMDGPIADLADAAGPAQQAFKPVKSSPASNHLTMWSSLAAGGGELAGHLFGGHGLEAAIGAAAIPAAYHGTRAGARSLALGPLGQRNAVALDPGPWDRTAILANLLTAQGRIKNDQTASAPTASQ